ncbi:MAG: T9SS type A sorting domain-containing protein [Sphingobacteriales bacterium]
MKKFLPGIFVLFSFVTLQAQTIPFCETFGTTRNDIPSGWILSQGAKIDAYNNPDFACATENGIITPGVGGNNPANVLSAPVISPVAGGKVFARFDIWPFDANLTCLSRANQFLCATTCDIYITPSSYTATTVPTGTDLLASYTGFVMTNGGSYGFIVDLPAGVTNFKMLFRFGAQSANCNQPGTKYVLDNFCFSLSDCQSDINCPPVANDDAYVLPTNDKFQTFKADLTGGSLQYLPSPVGYSLFSLLSGAGNNAVDDGIDFDPDGHTRAQMTWTLVDAGSAATYGTVTVHPDGTFDYVRNGVPAGSQVTVSFRYRLTDTTTLSDDAIAYITIPSNAGLPVKFLSFNAQQVNGKVALNWKTASEINNKEFEVQRRMSTGGGFQTIASVVSKAFNGYSGIVLDYNYDDLASLVGAGQVYYRIKQIDLNGHSDYSEIRSIRNNARTFNITVYPNPGKDLVKVTIPDGAGIVDISVSDMSGKEVKRWNSTGVKNIELTNLRPGMYTIRVNVKETGDVLVNKLIIQ